MTAAIQAPIIMMSQNRQADKDRLQAANDYEVNLKAELEIERLHEKLDATVLPHVVAIVGAAAEDILILNVKQAVNPTFVIQEPGFCFWPVRAAFWAKVDDLQSVRRTPERIAAIMWR
jgi:uncharacterized membrane protein